MTQGELVRWSQTERCCLSHINIRRIHILNIQTFSVVNYKYSMSFSVCSVLQRCQQHIQRKHLYASYITDELNSNGAATFSIPSNTVIQTHLVFIQFLYLTAVRLTHVSLCILFICTVLSASLCLLQTLNVWIIVSDSSLQKHHTLFHITVVVNGCYIIKSVLSELTELTAATCWNSLLFILSLNKTLQIFIFLSVISPIKNYWSSFLCINI